MASLFSTVVKKKNESKRGEHGAGEGSFCDAIRFYCANKKIAGVARILHDEAHRSRGKPRGPSFARSITLRLMNVRVGVFCKWLFLFLSSPTTNEQKNLYKFSCNKY